MKLINDELEFIRTVLKVANTVNIGNIIIEPGKVRAMDDDQTIVLFQDTNVPNMSFGSIGLNRINVFDSRLELARSQDNFNVEAVVTGIDNEIGFDIYDPTTKNPAPMWVRSLLMSGKGTKIDYRCASPQTIKAPKKRAGVIQYRIDINADMVNMIQKGSNAMKADELTFNGGVDGVGLSITDINGDSLEYHFTDVVHLESTGDVSDFSYKYSIKTVLPIFKLIPTGSFFITTRGSLVMSLHGLDIYIMARA